MSVSTFVIVSRQKDKPDSNDCCFYGSWGSKLITIV